ncbi:MAG: hypothetical protein J07AB43_13330 [Candidatus Nanosalina sp. J07AB43]|jgi:hypothetical protein|nr:MAG: hypothetical protein J07AB43_13330 [Candidatus Nanosalina sp. J07AB43]
MFEQYNLGRNQKIAGVLFLAAILFVSSALWLESQVSDEVRTFQVSANVEPQTDGNVSMGVNTGQGLDYGNLTYNTNYTKFLEISADRKTLLTSKVSGNISEIAYHDSQIYFVGNRSFEMTLGSKDPGLYEGELQMRFQTPETKRGSKWISLKNKLF